ncbi:ImmA/IrrE family metallo-endopeptidase [Luteococcus sp. H138]|uniref:helix-turn-helix domain-containing protein n=1 Tax=unclassified Luteococcus TaxID=2639923 RepID=UPI00313D085A
MNETIGARVAKAIPEGVTRRQIAAKVGIAEDAFSRALHGKRGFSALELARLGEALEVDVHELITGRPDPNRLVLAARHQVDRDTWERTNDGAADDKQILADVGIALRNAARVAPQPASTIPQDVEDARAALGSDFVRPFMERLRDLGIDVVRVAGLGTSYSLHVGNRAVIAVPENGNWFRENWDMAHELGHLVLGHREVDCTTRNDVDREEAAANAFAAELLLPAEEMRAVDWSSVTPAEVAGQVWARGVSTSALATRIGWLKLPVDEHLLAGLDVTTQRYLRQHRKPVGGGDPITTRMKEAATRSFPDWVVTACLDGVATGVVRKSLLAWVLGVDEEALEVEESEAESIDGDKLMNLLS